MKNCIILDFFSAVSLKKSNIIENVPESMLYSRNNVETIELVRYVPKMEEEVIEQHDMLRQRSGKTGYSQEAPNPVNFKATIELYQVISN